MMHQFAADLHAYTYATLLIFAGSLSFFCSTSARADFLSGSYAFSSVSRFQDDGTPLGNGIGFGSAGLNQAAGVTVGPDGNIYVSSIASGEILFYDGATGAPLPSPHDGGRDGLFATLVNEGNEEMPVGGPSILRFGPNGNLYVADFQGQSVRTFDGTTGVEGTPAASVFVGPAGGFAFGPDGALYVGDFGAASVIRFDGGIPSLYVTPQSGGLFTASSLLFLPNGHLLVCDAFGNQVIEYDEHGENPSLFATIPPLDNPPNPEGQNPLGSNFPSDLAFDQDGNILLAVLGYDYVDTGEVLRFDLEGNPLGDPPGTPVVDNAVTLSSIAWIRSATAIDGDFNGDDLVDASDYEKWKADFGKWVAKGGGADGNGDGIVDAADYTVWRNALPEIAEAGVGAMQSVPEPASAAIAVIGVLLMFATSTNKRRG